MSSITVCSFGRTCSRYSHAHGRMVLGNSSWPQKDPRLHLIISHVTAFRDCATGLPRPSERADYDEDGTVLQLVFDRDVIVRKGASIMPCAWAMLMFFQVTSFIPWGSSPAPAAPTTKYDPTDPKQNPLNPKGLKPQVVSLSEIPS